MSEHKYDLPPGRIYARDDVDFVSERRVGTVFWVEKDDYDKLLVAYKDLEKICNDAGLVEKALHDDRVKIFEAFLSMRKARNGWRKFSVAAEGQGLSVLHAIECNYQRGGECDCPAALDAVVTLDYDEDDLS